MDVFHLIALFMVGAGVFFMLVGSIGIIRLPDFFSRTHAIGKSDTLGIMLAIGGMAVYTGLTLEGIKLLIAIIFVAIANPVGAHALAKAAFRFGLKPKLQSDADNDDEQSKG